MIDTMMYLLVLMTLLFSLYFLLNTTSKIVMYRTFFSVLYEEYDVLRNNLVSAGTYRPDPNIDWGWYVSNHTVSPVLISQGLATIPDKDLSIVLPTVLDERKIRYLVSRSKQCIFTDIKQLESVFTNPSYTHCFTFFGLYLLTKEEKGLRYIVKVPFYFSEIQIIPYYDIYHRCPQFTKITLQSGLVNINKEKADYVCLVRPVLIYTRKKEYCPALYIHCLYFGI